MFEVAGLRSIAVAAQKVHGDQRVKEILNPAWMQAEFGAEFRANEVAIAQLREEFHLDGGEEDFGIPKRKSGFQDRRRIERWIHEIIVRSNGHFGATVLCASSDVVHLFLLGAFVE